MKFYKLRVSYRTGPIASSFNESFVRELIPESADPYRVDWITDADEEVLVGEKVRNPLPVPTRSFSLRSDRHPDASVDLWVAAAHRHSNWLIPMKWGTLFDGRCMAVTSTRAIIRPISSS